MVTTTALEMSKYIGKEASLEVPAKDPDLPPLSVRVRIVDVKMTYNQPRLQITPVAGSGMQWVTLKRLTF